jgi:cytochrome c oxidase subunit 3
VKRVSPFADQRERTIAGKFGLLLFLVSLAVLFAASLVGFAVIRYQIGEKWPSDLPPLPRVLWLSTLTLVFSSGVLQWSVMQGRAGRIANLRIGLAAALVLGLVFLAMQTLAWMTWLEPISDMWETAEEFRFALACFYVLTILHAAHVIGGVIPMAASFLGWMGASSNESPRSTRGLELVAMYWHFLGVVWLVLFATLLIWL